ncbi:MAG TPA: AAA family ATPase, partial [Anaeromyxobacteraceae bacterium]|nr:AAA family ATPase [Anaeromyxobacteraceae bacterium]
MTYLEFFQLSQEPFSNAPVARFYYSSAQHAQALMRLMHAVQGMKGLAVLVGDIG